jgi:hypothetical protein
LPRATRRTPATRPVSPNPPWPRVLLVGALLLGAAVVAATAVAGRGGSAGGTADVRALATVEFVTVCRFSHRAPDDPIVFPRRPERSHDHTFFGSVATDAFSTPRSLRAAPTSCQRADDTAAYWAPTLLLGTKAVEALDAEVYYRRRTLSRVRPFPPGLEMIAGDANARRPQSRRVTFWDCGPHGGVAPATAVPTCPDARAKSLRLNVRFPDCWDGRRADSADHRRHMAYSVAGACSRTHPVAVPSIELRIQYPVTGAGAIQLSSRTQFSGHADFVNGWRQDGLKRLVDYCLNALRACGTAG